MSFLRGIGTSPYDAGEPAARTAGPYQQELRTADSTHLGVGTLACERCDAPVALGGEPLSPVASLCCPYCDHTAPLRDFLSLAAPVRPTRVVVRVRASRA